MLIVAYSLLVLYSLPLIVLLITFAATEGFAEASLWAEFTVALSKVYLSPVRDALGTFVVPFLTAYAVSSIQKGVEIKLQTLVMFFVLILIFVVSILVYCAVDMRGESLVQSLQEWDQGKLKSFSDDLKSMSGSYVKETLAYISLLIGISQSAKVGAK